MGCDIHMIAQVRRKDSAVWETLLWPNDKIGRWGDEGRMTPMMPNPRAYDLFAILADVRNGMGFAGCDTGDGFKPIVMPRGLPDDMDDEYVFVIDGIQYRAYLGDHSYSWLTYKEVKEYDYTQTTKKRTLINASERKRMLDATDATPEVGCGMVSGPGIRHITLEELDAEIVCGTVDPDAYAPYEWEVTYKDQIDWWLKGIDFALDGFALWHGAENVRLVFGFDS